MLGKNIRILRIEKGLSQVELAKNLNVTKQSVSNWENNNILPSIDMLIKLSEYFNVSTDYLLGLNERKYLEVTHLTNKQLSHVQQIINDICLK